MVTVMSMMNKFEFDARFIWGAFVPIAINPKSVAKSNGPGGYDALMYNNTADPIKRNTAMIALGCSKVSIYVEVQHEKRDTPASRYPPVKIIAGTGVLIISERAKLASLTPRHDQLQSPGLGRVT